MKTEVLRTETTKSVSTNIIRGNFPQQAKPKRWDGLIANCGIGKTEILINTIVSRLESQNGATKFIYAAPTIELANSFRSRLRTGLRRKGLLWNSRLISVFTGKQDDGDSVAEHLEKVIENAKSGDIIIITHATMKTFGFSSIQDGWSLAIDEIFNPLEIGFVEFNESSKESEENLLKFLDVNRDDTVSIKQGSIEKFKDALKFTNELAANALTVGRWLTEDNFEVVWREEKESDKKGKLVQYRGYRLDDLTKFNRFEEVRILGANIEPTAMNLLLNKVFNIKIIDSPLIEHKEYRNSNNITVYPLYGGQVECHPYTRSAADTLVKPRERKTASLMLVSTASNISVEQSMINQAKDLVKGLDCYHVLNYREGENKDQFVAIEGLGKRISPDCRGINNLRHCNAAVIIFCARPNPYMEASTIDYIESRYHMNKGDLNRAITYQRMHDTVLQGAMRGNCRMDEGDNYVLCVPDMESALLFKKGAPDCDIDTSYMIEAVKNKVGRPQVEIDYEKLKELLLNQELGLRAIGKVLNISAPSVAKHKNILARQGCL